MANISCLTQYLNSKTIGKFTNSKIRPLKLKFEMQKWYLILDKVETDYITDINNMLKEKKTENGISRGKQIL